MKRMTLSSTKQGLKTEPQKPVLAKRVLSFAKRYRVLLVIGVVLLVVVSFAIYKGFSFYKFITDTGLEVEMPVITVPWADKEPVVLNQDENGYTNALIVGIDTRPNGEFMSTDTIMLISYDRDRKIASMISIPRDTVVQHMHEGWTSYYDRINAMYMSSQQKYDAGEWETDGLQYLTQVVENYLGLKIHHSVLVNLQGFRDIIDAIGGVDVDVENAFTDYDFPTYEGGSIVVTFKKGVTHMDGEKALQYARSRHAAWPEGTDYARSRRQQRLLTAIRDKMLSDKVWLDVEKISNIIEALGNNIKFYNVSTTDIQNGVRVARDEGLPEMFGIVLDPAVANWTLLCEGCIDFGTSPQYAVTPKPYYYDYSQMHSFTQDFFLDPQFVSEDAAVLMYSGSNKVGYSGTYKYLSKLIEKYYYTQINWGGTFILSDLSTVLENAVADNTTSDTTTTTSASATVVIFCANTDKAYSAEVYKKWFQDEGVTVLDYQGIDLKALYGEDIVIIITS